MAQHCLLDIREYPQIEKSVKRLAKYYLRFEFMRKDWRKEDQVYTKTVLYVPTKEYKIYDTDYLILDIGTYKLDKKDYGENGQKTSLECHFDRQGNINGLFYVL